MNELESLRRLTEAVETAKADIAPTYIEYVHLAFAIATDCGEEGRDFFHRLCRVSAKYQREHAERIFSNALTANHGDMHLGTVFYLAEAAGVTVRKEEVANSRTGTKGTAGTAQKLSAHTCARNKVYNSESPESEELLPGSEPKHLSGSRLAGTPATYYELRKHRRTERCHAIGSTDRSGFLHGTVCTVSLWR